jgi:hypothetical protein
VYTLERLWNPGDRFHLPEYFRKATKFEMYDFTAHFARRDKLWRRIQASRMPFACLNNISPSDKVEFEHAMRIKKFGDPCYEPQGCKILIQEAD